MKTNEKKAYVLELSKSSWGYDSSTPAEVGDTFFIPKGTMPVEQYIDGADCIWYKFEKGCPCNINNFYRRDSFINPKRIPGFAEATNDNERAVALGEYLFSNDLRIKVVNKKDAKTRSGYLRKYYTFEIL